MFSKNLKYYRCKKFMSQRQLAALCHISPMTISHYESGKRKPDNIQIIEKLASVLDIQVSDFLVSRDANIKFTHGEFRKKDDLNRETENQIKGIIEEYFERLYDIMSIIGGEILPKPIQCKSLEFTNNSEQDAYTLRQYLHFSNEGPIYNLIGTLENKGILICLVDINNYSFSGINGFVNNRPYIAINNKMNEERKRSTIVHELIHLLFKDTLSKKKLENKIEEIMGSFLITKEDLTRELGYQRKSITKDMCLVCKEYGISMSLLVMRAYQCKIISNQTKKQYYESPQFSNLNHIKLEESTLLKQLVYRAIAEENISIQKGAELLKMSYQEMVENC